MLQNDVEIRAPKWWLPVPQGAQIHLFLHHGSNGDHFWTKVGTKKLPTLVQKISNFEKKNHQLWAKKITAFFEMASSQFSVSKSIPDHQYLPGKTRLLWWCRNKWISDWGGSLFGLQLLSKMAPTFDQKWHQLWSKVVPTFVQKCSQLLVKKWSQHLIKSGCA